MNLAPEGQPLRADRAGMVLLIVCAAQLVFAVDVTVVLVANVRIEHSLGFSEAGIAWVATAYALTYGGLLLLCGRLSDRIGHRRCFLIGIAGFGVASALAASALDPTELIVARALQGATAAMVGPGALALLTAQFPEGRRRTRALGFWAASGSAGGIVGYTAGGFLVGYLGWRSAFIINVPIALFGVLGGMRWLPRPKKGDAPTRLALDGAVAVTLGLAALIYAVGEASTHGWGGRDAVSSLIVAAVSLAVFVRHENRAPNPLIPRAVFVRRESLATVATGLQAATVGAAVFLGSLYLQQVVGWNPEHVGAATLPIPLGVAVGAFVGTRLLRRHDCGAVLAGCGSGAMALGLVWIAWRVGHDGYVAVLLPGWALLGVGLAVSQLTLVTVATSGVEDHDRGAVAGVYTMSQQVGSAIGLSVLTTVAVAHGAGSVRHADALEGLRVAMGATAALAVAAVVVTSLAGRVRRRAESPVVLVDVPVLTPPSAVDVIAEA